jgi:hypothetical protein
MNVPTRIAGAARPAECAWPQLLERFGNAIPPYPSATTVPPVVIPAPPLIPEDLPDAEAAQRVALATITALEVKAALRLVNLRQRVARGEYRARCAEFADALRNARIAPMAWALFSYDQWMSGPNPASRVPGLVWVTGITRFNQRRTWYMDERLRYEAERVYLTPLHRKLAARWQVMQAALLREADTLDDGRVQAVVAAHYRPDGTATYAQAVEVARARAHNAQHEVNMQVQRGECLW